MIVPGMYLAKRYEILEKIGAGGMADVYKAKDHVLNRFVAIKVLKRDYSSDATFVKKFRVEAQSAAGLSHPNIVNVYDVGEEDGIHYIVMELVQGITLKNYIDMKGKLGIREALNISVQIASGLSAAHDNRIIHRDIKPQNIIMSRDGKVKVTDFGIAKVADSTTVTTTAAGTVHYISPEQARGGYSDEKSDIYSLGITMYEMVTGRVPFDGETNVAVALLHIQGEITPPRELEPDIPQSFEKIILKCTQKKPDRRYASARELIADLRKVLTHPDGEYVVIAGDSSTRRTIVMKDNEVSSLKEASLRRGLSKGKTEDQNNRSESENLIVTKKHPSRKQELDPDPDLDEEVNPALGKVMMGLGIAGFIILTIIILYIVGNAIGLFGGSKGLFGNKETKESVATESMIESTTESETDSAETVEVPNLVGYSKDDIKKLLKDAKLDYKFVEGSSDDYEEGQAYDQNPAAGIEVKLHDQITVYISTGSNKFELDDVSGMDYSRAKAQLESLGLYVSLDFEDSDDVDVDRVIRTEPAAGNKVAKGDSVKIIASQGKKLEMVTVPDVRGMDLDTAIASLESQGLIYNSKSTEYSDNYSEGQVMGQSLTPYTSVQKGTYINLTVSAGPKVTSYSATIAIESPFGIDIKDGNGEIQIFEEGRVQVVLEQDGLTKTVYDQTTTENGLDSSVSVSSASSSAAIASFYINGILYSQKRVSFQ